MSEGKTGKKANQTAGAGSKSQPSFTWVLYMVILVIAAGLFAIFNYQKRIQREDMLARIEAEQIRNETLAELNTNAGLPETYPADFMPLYPGVQLLEASAADAKADDGSPMDKWHVLSQIDEDKQVVYDFYKARIEAEDLRQTMYISLPSGYSISYADENRIVELRIEKLRSDPMLQIEITIYIVKGKPASKSPYDLASAVLVDTDSMIEAEPFQEEPTAPEEDDTEELSPEEEPISDPPA